MGSLLHVLEGRFDDAIGVMQAAAIHHDPEALMYFARHYAYMGKPDQAIGRLRRAAMSGFVCAPATLRADKWLQPLKRHPEFAAIMTESAKMVDQARSQLKDFQMWLR